MTTVVPAIRIERPAVAMASATAAGVSRPAPSAARKRVTMSSA